MTMRNHTSNSKPSLARPHAQREEALPVYATLLATGQKPGDEWRELELHLESCQACRDELAAIVTALRETTAGLIARAAHYPKLDLPFLDSSSPADRLTSLARQAVVWVGDLLRSDMASQRLAGSFRSSPSGDAAPPGDGAIYYQRDPGADLSISIEVTATDRARQLCRVTVTVDDPLDPMPERESQVLLQYDLVSKSATTDIGAIAFADIPAAALDQIRITVTKPSHPPHQS